jgi:hypothetical protein
VERWTQIEYPHVLAFLGLYGCSIFTGFFAASPKLLGLLLLGWGFFSVLRVLWLAEVIMVSHRPDQVGRVRLLPWIILSALERRKRLEAAVSALYTFNVPFYIFAAGVAGYGAWAVFVAGDVPALGRATILFLAVWNARTYACNRDYAEVLLAGAPLGAGLALGAALLTGQAAMLFLGLWVCLAVLFTRYEADIIPKRRPGIGYKRK